MSSLAAALTDVIAFGGCLFIFNMTLNYIVESAKNSLKLGIPQMKLDAFLKENGYSWSYVFVFKVLDEDNRKKLSPEQQKYSLRNVVERLHNAQFETSQFYSCQRDEVNYFRFTYVISMSYVIYH
jgi:hypothetical protein